MLLRLLDNPVLRYELVTKLRQARTAALLLIYVGSLAFILAMSWPELRHVTVGSPQAGQQLFESVTAGQLLLIVLVTPALAAGAMTGEKERRTYELLMSAPIEPGLILAGKLLSSLAVLVLLILCTIPLTIIVWVLGGVALADISAAYLMLILAAFLFGLASLALSCSFNRTAPALVGSYLVAFPAALALGALWQVTSPEFRLFASQLILPPVAVLLGGLAAVFAARKMIEPPELAQAQQITDEEKEQEQVVGLVIQRNQFPDFLFAPPKRNELLPDGKNPVLDKELRSDIFAHGTSMLRLVIQVSMGLAIPLMAAFLFFLNWLSYVYIWYVLAFNILVGPAFSAVAITQERERHTIELLLTTLLSPREVIGAKLLASLRVGTSLTLLLAEPILLAFFLVPELRAIWPTMFAYLAVIVSTCLLTGTLGVFMSAVSSRTAAAVILTYLVLLLLFLGPHGAYFLLLSATEMPENVLCYVLITSPFAAAATIPPGALESWLLKGSLQTSYLWIIHISTVLVVTLVLYAASRVAFRKRWRWVA